MGTLARIGTELRFALRGFAVALLPSPERERLANRWQVDAASYSFSLGLIEAVGGGLMFFFGAIACMLGTVPFLNQVLIDNWFEGLSSTHFRGGGLVGLLVWCLHPVAWLCILEGITGIVRVAAFVADRQGVGEPLVWLVLRVVQLVVRGSGRARRARDLGPLRPDRLVWHSDSDLEILSCRERPEWTDSVALGIDDRFFRLTGLEDRADGMHTVVAYRFAELDPNEVIRRAVLYRDVVE
jgi:hypothetical protein